MPHVMTSIRLATRLADEAAAILGVKNRTEAVHAALREVVALKKFQRLMKKHAGKLKFEGHGKQSDRIRYCDIYRPSPDRPTSGAH